MVVFAIIPAGMQQGKSRAQHIPVRKPFAGVRKCVGATLETLVKCCRNLFQPAVHLEDAVVLVISFTRTRRCQQVYSRMKRRQSRRAMGGGGGGDDSPTCNDRSLGSNDADIDPHPPTLPPTNTIGT